MDDETLSLDPNTADLETLQRLPGVGPSLAQRIVEGRPFTRLSDLRRVAGLGEAALARLEPYIRFAAPAEGEAPAPPTEAPETSGPVESDGRRPADPVGAARPVSRRDVVQAAIAAAAAGVVLSVLLTLAILAGINGSLDAGRNRTVREMRTQVSQAAASLEQVSTQLGSLDGRLQALEGLSGRMTAVEAQVSGMQTDIDEAVRQVAVMQTSVAAIEADIQTLEAGQSRFVQFLAGLGRLVDEAAATPEPESGGMR